MHCDYALGFLRDILKKCQISTALLSVQDPLDAVLHSATLATLLPTAGMSVGQLLGHIEDHTKYCFTDELMLRYVFLRLPTASERDLLFIGPYLTAPRSPEEALEVGEALGLSPNAQAYLTDYFQTLPVLSDSTQMNAVIDSFCEHVWQTQTFADRKSVV